VRCQAEGVFAEVTEGTLAIMILPFVDGQLSVMKRRFIG
jgi:hypothetical protein